jgi:hypothetical protein
VTIRPQRFQVVQVGDAARLFISAALDEWAPLEESGIEARDRSRRRARSLDSDAQ